MEIDTLDETFRAKPNLKNLKKFFHRDIIQKFWMHQASGFQYTREVHDIIIKLDQMNKEALFRQAEVVLPKHIFGLFT